MSSNGRRVGKYLLGRTLGQGTFGKVKFAIDTESSKAVAIKMMDKAKIRSSNMSEQIKKEISIMKMIKHESVIQLIEVLASPTTIYIVLELASGGELFDRIIQNGRMDEDTARSYFNQLIDGIAFCHAHNVCHRDLKPENLLVTDDEPPKLKISDFGLSAMQATGQTMDSTNQSSVNLSLSKPTDNPSTGDTPNELLHTTCGTPNYVAPEVLMDKGYDGKAADLWSTGVILYVLLAGFLPFDEISMVDLFRKIVNADFQFPSWFSMEAKDLLVKILNPDPEKRAKIQDIKNHIWLRRKSIGTASATNATPRKSEKFEKSLVMPLDAENATLNGSPGRSTGLPSPSGKSSRERRFSLGFTNVRTGQNSLDLTAVMSSPNNPITGFAAESESASHPELDGPEEMFPSQNKSAAAAGGDANPRASGILKMNAFDLINMAGGAAMNRLFQSGSERQLRAFTQFTSNLPANTILQLMEESLEKINKENLLTNSPIIHYRSFPSECQLKMSVESSTGALIAVFQIYEMTPTLQLIEGRKLHGDIFVYHTFFKNLKRKMYEFGAINAADSPENSNAELMKQKQKQLELEQNYYDANDNEVDTDNEEEEKQKKNNATTESADKPIDEELAAKLQIINSPPSNLSSSVRPSGNPNSLTISTPTDSSRLNSANQLSSIHSDAIEISPAANRTPSLA